MVKFNTCPICGNAWISGNADTHPAQCDKCNGVKRARGPVKKPATPPARVPLRRGPVVREPLRRGPAKVGHTIVITENPQIKEAIRTQPIKPASDGMISNYLRSVDGHQDVAPFGGRSLIVTALAGTGKTTTCDEGLWRLGREKKLKGSDQQEAVWDWMLSGERPKDIALTSMGRSITDVLKKRIGNRAFVNTVHGMGLKACIKAFRIDPETDLKKWRTEKLLEEYHKEDMRQLRKQHKEYVNYVVALTNLAKLTLTAWDEDSLEKLGKVYYLDKPDGSFSNPHVTVGWLLHRSQDQIESIDYTDMLWLPVVKKLKLPVYDLLMVDEAQDLNRVQQEFVLRSCQRMMLVGDPHQAIYGFAGADCRSMSRMTALLEERGDVQQLPLTVSRRCGKLIVDEAKKLVPEFEAHPDNPNGGIKRNIDQEVSERSLADGSMVLCRLNGPLVSLVFRLIRQEKKATIQGRDIGQGLLTFIRDTLKAETVSDLRTKLSEYYNTQYKEISNRRYLDESALINLGDKVECIRSLTDGCKSIRDIEERVTTIFKDDEKQGILLSSVHRAKGLESRRVSIIEPGLMPWNCKSPEQMEQEYNLKYVAITRAIEELNFVKDTPKRKDNRNEENN